MNVLNIAKHLLYLAQTEYGSGHSAIPTDEIFAAERLFEILKFCRKRWVNFISIKYWLPGREELSRYLRLVAFILNIV